jgi:hypothetical protein
VNLDFSRWQQNLIGVLQFDIEYHEEAEMGNYKKIGHDKIKKFIHFLI